MAKEGRRLTAGNREAGIRKEEEKSLDKKDN
jgi:hypothetical protein